MMSALSARAAELEAATAQVRYAGVEAPTGAEAAAVRDAAMQAPKAQVARADLNSADSMAVRPAARGSRNRRGSSRQQGGTKVKIKDGGGGDGGDGGDGGQDTHPTDPRASDKTKQPGAYADGDGDQGDSEHSSLFVMFVSNGMFWLVPFVLQGMLAKMIGSGIIDNGRLSPVYFKCAFVARGD